MKQISIKRTVARVRSFFKNARKKVRMWVHDMLVKNLSTHQHESFDQLYTRIRSLIHNKQWQKLKLILYEIIFEADTFWGKAFDVLLMLAIFLSVVIAIFGSMFTSHWLIVTVQVLETIFTVFFTAEYVLRVYCSPRSRDYVLSFFGIIDLLAILPVYLEPLLAGAQYMIILRSFRLIRVFRVFKLFNFLNEGNLLLFSLRRSFSKIMVFFLFVVILVICLGSMMYIVEGGQPDSAFKNVPNSIYWAIVTLTTVGYGDITPTTGFGRLLSALVMLLGYTIIAVPTGIVTADLTSDLKNKSAHKEETPEATSPDSHAVRHCPRCGLQVTNGKAVYCERCGAKLPRMRYHHK